MSSAQVISKEVDLSTRVPSFPGVYGAMAFAAAKGPVNSPQLMTTDTQFLSTFTPAGVVNVGFDLGYFSALAFLQKSNKLWVVRSAKQSLYASAVFRMQAVPNTNPIPGAGLADPTAYLFDAGPDIDVPAVAQITQFTF